MPDRDTDLGPTLRAWRARLAPEAAGFRSSRGRRTSGLRREEIADLARISVDYVIRLEQGRATTPSRQVVESLARALQLDRVERDHLFRLAGLHATGAGDVSDRIPAGMTRLLTRLGQHAAIAVFAADWQLLWWNDGWAALLGDPAELPEKDRNFARDTFAAPGGRRALAQWPVRSSNEEAVERAVAADLRDASSRYSGAARLQRLVRDLRDESATFERLWAGGDVGHHIEDEKIVEHPLVGAIRVDCDVLVSADGDLKTVCLSPIPGSDDESRYQVAVVSGGTGWTATPSSALSGRSAAAGSGRPTIGP